MNEEAHPKLVWIVKCEGAITQKTYKEYDVFY
jgi:hypothetical protein